jgi:hypothetical protein
MAAGVVRIIEICFVLEDKPSDNSNIRILQYLPPYVSEHSFKTFSSLSLVDTVLPASDVRRHHVHERY